MNWKEFLVYLCKSDKSVFYLKDILDDTHLTYSHASRKCTVARQFGYLKYNIAHKKSRGGFILTEYGKVIGDKIINHNG